MSAGSKLKKKNFLKGIEYNVGGLVKWTIH